MEPFGDVADVARRLDFTLDALEESAVEAALEDLSDEARFHAGREWADPALAPYPVRMTVVKAVARWARNMHGYVQSRAGDETLIWSDLGPEAGAAAFTTREIRLLKAAGEGRTGSYVGAVEVVARTPQSGDDGTLPIAPGQKPFPMFNPLTDGW